MGINILLADDHTLFRKALRELVGSLAQISKFHEASNGLEVLETLATHPIDLILLDIQMPEMGGMDTLKQLREDGLQTKVIILTQYEEESLIACLLQHGANGFLTKKCNPKELQNAMTAVMTGGHYYDHRVSQAIEHNLASHETFSNLNISHREFQVLSLLKNGRSNAEIARILGLAKSTVESYRKALIKKVKCKNTVDLISLSYRTGMLPV